MSRQAWPLCPLPDGRGEVWRWNLGTVAAGFSFRLVARQLLATVPVAGWALKGAVAYGGTRAIGEAARHYFAATAT